MTNAQVGDVRIDDVLRLMSDGQRTVDVSDVGPRGAVKRLRLNVCNESLNGWCETARVQALLGSCPRSVGSFKSGVRAWLDFVDTVLIGRNHAFPPSLGGLLAWSNTFRCEGTFSN